jgi:hypothetical protein
MTLLELADSLRQELDEHLKAVRKIADMIEAMGKPEPEPELPAVPYRSQWDADAILVKSDCGPACVAMMLGYRSIGVTIDDISKFLGMGPSKNYTTPADLQKAAKKWGLALEVVSGWTLEQFVGCAPCIMLVHYGTIPDRMDAKYMGGHWIILLGVNGNNAVYHDPDWWGPSRDLGAGRVVDTVRMALAMRDCMIDGNQQGLGLVMTLRTQRK